MILRGTIYIYPKDGVDLESPLRPTMLRFVKERDVAGEAAFKYTIRVDYPNPDVVVAFGPIGAPWGMRA